MLKRKYNFHPWSREQPDERITLIVLIIVIYRVTLHATLKLRESPANSALPKTYHESIIYRTSGCRREISKSRL